MYALLVLAWCFVNLVFWAWWLSPDHVETPWLYLMFSAAFAYDVVFLPTMYLFFVGRMRRPRPMWAPPDLKAALITLCVPSAESLDVIVRQLQALRAVGYPHDSWVLDEGNDPAVRQAAKRLGVHYFSRAGIDRYNQPVPPFKARTKAGNVNAWLDAYGKDYEFFVQFDIDHIPRSDYLDWVLGFFRDPEVAWVQAPSVYGNLENWVARGAAEQELVLQGPLQQGFFGASETPFIIGSHCTYRTSAILAIDGFQPTRAEDHLNTVMLAASGYRGVFVPQIIAVGDGPDTFETYLRQQFAWALSLMEVLFRYSPRLIWRERPMQALQFLFAQSWYVLWSASMAGLFLMPLVVLITGQRPSNVPLPMFLLAWAPLNLTTSAISWWTRRWQVPHGLSLSWRGVILHVARWPIVFWAFLNLLLHIKHPYMITPKRTDHGLPGFSLRSQVVYVFAVWLTGGVVWIFLIRSPAYAGQQVAGAALQSLEGYIALALWGATFPLVVFLTNILVDVVGLRRRGIAVVRLVRLRLIPFAVLLTTGAMVMVTGALAGDRLLVGALSLEGSPTVATETGGASHARAILLQSAREAAGVVPGPLGSWLGMVGGPAAPASPFDLPVDRRALGAYDPWQTLAAWPLDVEHWFVRQDEPELLKGALAHARNRRTVLATIEPFPASGQSASVLSAVAAGELDDQLRQLARIARASSPQVVLVRWGHEMDLAGLYPWSTGNPPLYRTAFRHVVELFREEGALNVRWVWSPAGNEGAAGYYPGSDVVDYVGVTVLADDSWDQELGLAPRSFAELLAPKYELMAPFQKPIVIAELGVSGSSERQADLLLAFAHALDDFRLVRAVSYFNDVNAPNPSVAVLPDWRVAPEAFAPFVQAVSRARG